MKFHTVNIFVRLRLGNPAFIKTYLFYSLEILFREVLALNGQGNYTDRSIRNVFRVKVTIALYRVRADGRLDI